jgi:acyl-CoA synthetase (AMP-forming)/AMP-acid ligase II
LSTFTSGGTVIVRNNTKGLDPAGLLDTLARERATAVLIIGDAFGRPLLAQLQESNYELPCLRTLITGGAALSVEVKLGLVEQLPGLTILDAVGSSESGNQGNHFSTGDGEVATGSFEVAPGSLVLNAELTGRVPQGDTQNGWFARSGRIPLGYLGDENKTLRTFPIVDGTRYSVPGDRARWSHDGRVELLGRDSVTINSGGEKIFAEEVEQALKHDASVYDAIVVGRASSRWGQEVVAVVQLVSGATSTAEELRLTCSAHIARYKLPRDVVFVDEIRRSPSGKADYAWARERASDQRGQT